MEKIIHVTQPYLPPFEDYIALIKKAWEKKWLTNHGPLVQELEQKIKEFLGVKNFIFVSNGTIALQIAIKALELKNEIITTPFSYVATTNSILWEGCTPVFADINNVDYNIDASKIEALITDRTSAILATHVYGNPCDVEAIDKIAKKHGLKVIYDAAHAFGTIYKKQQLLSFGDIATCSFHATKLFHTIEGGGIVTNDAELAKRMNLYKSFGHIGDEYISIGINGKNSEFHAAMGLCLLPNMASFISKRRQLSELYIQLLKNLPLTFPKPLQDTIYNFSYFPVLFESEEQLLHVKGLLEKNGISARRYFYPSLNRLPQHTGEACPVSEFISKRVLSLPLFYELKEEEVEKICAFIKTCF